MVVLGIIGLPGSGKSTVASELCSRHGFGCIIVRKAADDAASIGQGLLELSLSDPSRTSTFSSLSDAADFAMTNWTRNYVLLGLDFTDEAIELFKKRPIFILMMVTAPIMARFARLKDTASLEAFAGRDDAVTSDPGFWNLQEYLKIGISNNGTILELSAVLGKLAVEDGSWMRPNWDHYFMRLADLASQRSNCMKRRVGAVIVQDCKVVATGYNGTPRNLKNCSEGGCPRCNGNVKCGLSLDSCICMHGEENAILEAGAGRCKGATIYSTSTPCLGCTKKLIQVGIRRVIFDIEYSIDHNSKELFDQAGIVLEKMAPSRPKYYSCK